MDLADKLHKSLGNGVRRRVLLWLLLAWTCAGIELLNCCWYHRVLFADDIPGAKKPKGKAKAKPQAKKPAAKKPAAKKGAGNKKQGAKTTPKKQQKGAKATPAKKKAPAAKGSTKKKPKTAQKKATNGNGNNSKQGSKKKKATPKKKPNGKNNSNNNSGNKGKQANKKSKKTNANAKPKKNAKSPATGKKQQRGVTKRGAKAKAAVSDCVSRSCTCASVRLSMLTWRAWLSGTGSATTEQTTQAQVASCHAHKGCQHHAVEAKTVRCSANSFARTSGTWTLTSCFPLCAVSPNTASSNNTKSKKLDLDPSRVKIQIRYQASRFPC